MVVPEWARDLFGDRAEDVRGRLVRAVKHAHDSAAAAQVAGEASTRDTYGHTMKVRRFECVVNELSDLDGVDDFKPKGASYRLVQFRKERVVVYPWRYGKTVNADRASSKVTPSAFERDLLHVDRPPAQLALDDFIDKTPEEITRDYEDQEDVLAQLGGAILMVAFASNERRLLKGGWGVAELVESGSGQLCWHHWEDLPLADDGGSDAGRSGGFGPASSGLGPADSGPRSPEQRPAVARFDEGPMDDDFGLRPRAPLSGEPAQEPSPQASETGTEPATNEEP